MSGHTPWAEIKHKSEPPKCGHVRTLGSKRSPVCELPPGSPIHGPANQHLGRSPSGRWFTWESKLAFGPRPGDVEVW